MKSVFLCCFLCLLLLMPIVAPLKLNCNFGRNKETFYLCQISNLRVDLTKAIIESVSGFHQKNLKNNDVTAFVVENSPNMECMPKAIDQFFPNIEAITVFNAGLVVINEADLQPFPNLRIFALENCRVISLEFNLFLHNPQLKTISFRNNQLETIEDRVFDYIDNLEKLDLSSNICIDKKADNRFKVRQVIKEIAAKCKKPLESPPNWLFNVDCVSSNMAIEPETPFLVALMHRVDSQLLCSGILITNKHILTPAHCVHRKEVEKGLEPSEIEVQLGRRNINSKNDASFEIRNVQKIFIHEKYNYDTLKYDGDVAVLVMDHPVLFSSSIGPVCLTPDVKVHNRVDGVAVGWGRKDNTTELMDHPQKSPVHSINNGLCFETQSYLGPFYTSKMFCATEDELGPCRADLGRGFFVLFHNKLTLRAIFAAGNDKCEYRRYSLFNKVSDYANWIKETVDANP